MVRGFSQCEAQTSTGQCYRWATHTDPKQHSFCTQHWNLYNGPKGVLVATNLHGLKRIYYEQERH